jgi:predicted PurR-regulated permease PerM
VSAEAEPGPDARPPAPADLRSAVTPARRELEPGDDGAGAVTGSVARAPLLRPLLRLPLKKVTIWAAFGLLLWVLWPYFPLVFLTFVLSYISSTIVDRIAPRFTNRRVPVVLVFAGLVGGVVALGFATIPRAIRQGKEQVRRLTATGDPKHRLDLTLARRLGEPTGAAALQGGLFGATAEKAADERGGVLHTLAQRLSDPGVDELVADNLATFRNEYVVPYLQGLIKGAWKAVVFTLLALLFSFMLVWDRPRIGEEMARLRESRLGDFYDEVAPSIATFGRLLGRAFEAQTVIALLNTSLSVIGMYTLGLSGTGLLAVIVFLCSFVPIAGVFISTVPMVLVALTQDDGGPGLALAVVGMVIVVHLIEAYVLNPRIYGHHMKLHPLAVLVVLYLAEQLLGLMGLVLGVPLATYAWRHLVLGEVETISAPPEPPAPAAPAPAAAAPAPPA